MAQRHRDFGAPADVNKEPVTFTLSGIVASGPRRGEAWKEDFVCVAEAPSGVLNDLVAGISVDEQGNRVYSAPNLIRFVLGVLRESEDVTDPEGDGSTLLTRPTDDVTRFQSLMHDKARIVPLDTLGELVMWLAEELSNRPSTPSGR